MISDTSAAFDTWAAGTPPDALSAALFRGRLLVFDDLAPVGKLADRARSLLSESFGTDHPPSVERRLSAPDFRRRALRARKIVGQDAEVARHWRATLAAVGYRPEHTWLDRIRLRVVPSRTDVGHPRLQALPPHRDTWGSGIAAQINWWLPLYPLADTRTMLLWPDAFRRAIDNDSAQWSVEAFRQAGQCGYPLLPSARERSPEPGIPVSIEPGQLLAFSAAHLHAGARDSSGTTRFGIDTRTVWDSDRRSGRGAPNVDCAAPTEMWRWYSAPPGATVEGTW